MPETVVKCSMPDCREAATHKIDGRCDVRAVPLLEAGTVLGVAAYLTAPER